MVPLSYLQIHLDRGAWCPTRSPARYSDHQHARAVCVQVPVVGITHRVCQLGALVYVIFNMYSGNGWAYSEVPLGSVNPWGAAQRVETGLRRAGIHAPTQWLYNSLRACLAPHGK